MSGALRPPLRRVAGLRSRRRCADPISCGGEGTPIGATLLTIVIGCLLCAPALRLLANAARGSAEPGRSGPRSPELYAGLFFVGAGLGIPLRMLGVARIATAPEVASWLNAAGHLLFAAGAIALYLFTRLVFRPGSRPAAVFCAAGVSAVALSTLAVFATGSLNVEQSASVLCTNLARVAAPGWAFFESLRYHRLMRRRLALGIGDPVVADRFRLWAIWTGALSLAPLLAAAARVAGRMLYSDAEAEVIEGALAAWAPPVLLGVRVLLALAVPFALYGIAMSFFPPTVYVERVRRRAAQVTA